MLFLKPGQHCIENYHLVSEVFVTLIPQLLMLLRRGLLLRRIYGPTKETDCTWRIKSNEELNRLTGNKNIINYIKAQRLA